MESVEHESRKSLGEEHYTRDVPDLGLVGTWKENRSPELFVPKTLKSVDAIAVIISSQNEM